MTIIVLLILASVSLRLVIGNEGILGKAIETRKKSMETESKERIQIVLWEYQIEKAEDSNQSLGKFFERKKEEGQIDQVEEKTNGTIKVKLNGYTATIEVETCVIVNFEETNEIEFTYQLISYENNKIKVSIKVADENNGIIAIEFPDSTKTQYKGQKEVELEYEMEEGVTYRFVAENSNGVKKEEQVNLTKPNEPQINDINLKYPLLTTTGIQEPKIEIKYDERADFINYYSIDEGQTWHLYTGPINVTSNLSAKSEHKKCSEIVVQKRLSTENLENLIGAEAYDGDVNTSCVLNSYPKKGNYYIEIDSEAIGKELFFNVSNVYYSSGGNGASIDFVDENYELVKNVVTLSNGGSSFSKRGIQVPQNSKYLKFSITLLGGPITIYEVGIFKD